MSNERILMDYELCVFLYMSIYVYMYCKYKACFKRRYQDKINIWARVSTRNGLGFRSGGRRRGSREEGAGIDGGRMKGRRGDG